MREDHAGPPPPPDAGDTAADPGACFVVTLAIDTDNRFLSDNFGSTSMAQAYIETLVGSANVVYERDANDVRSSTADSGRPRPWTTSTPDRRRGDRLEASTLEEFAADNPRRSDGPDGIAMCLSAENLEAAWRWRSAASADQRLRSAA